MHKNKSRPKPITDMSTKIVQPVELGWLGLIGKSRHLVVKQLIT